MNPQPGMVYLIGAGPGDPGLITVRGRECLERADVVLYDYLSGPRVLEWTRPGAELYCLGRHGHGKLWKQDEINAKLVECGKAGKTVARLKGGDPSIFGRLAEELDALTAAGIPFEIIPGISTAVASGAYAGVTITDRDQASCVTFLTGHEKPGKDEDSLDYAALAKLPGTLVIYMGVTTAEQWSSRLLEHGRPADTPVLLVRRCSLPDQQAFECTLGEVAGVLAPGKVRPPVVAIVGPVARRPEAMEWFSGRPLFGQTVLVTRPRHQAAPMVERLRELGSECLVQPAIKIGPPPQIENLHDAALRCGDFHWIVFSSSNGVESFMSAVYQCGGDARRLGGVKLAAIGPATVETLAEHYLTADLCPAEYRAEALAEALAPECSEKRVLLVRASRGREVLAEMLADAGTEIEQVVAYLSSDVTTPDPDIAEALNTGQVPWTTVTSSAIARSLVALFGEALRNTKLVAISPLTAGVLEELGYPAALVADEYTADGVIKAILRGCGA
ncbi:Uroporphyrinogen-III C-methyltransferase [Posidoniimonas polymericola]|uniref:uroporphyrinogen-III C-methyltransferase n=1 Tax=Posidoniimonas polymericola TaxID=2528002 RepID=A0A5C5YMK4_9BACT|nr:uroporphyrinogen-III C-methyltransferase [Posidoniimonas polymericola]TWT76060.1 Uroporphyrinogen-III C-methyltransferase [Posidoniimonas polymericola]